jgi:hypothetical protein
LRSSSNASKSRKLTTIGAGVGVGAGAAGAGADIGAIGTETGSTGLVTVSSTVAGGVTSWERLQTAGEARTAKTMNLMDMAVDMVTLPEVGNLCRLYLYPRNYVAVK